MAIKLDGYKKEVIDELGISEIHITEVEEFHNDKTVIYATGGFNVPHNSPILRKYKVDFTGVGENYIVTIRG